MDIIGKRKIWYTLSAILILPGVIALFLWGLKFGIDFKGGTQLEIQFSKPVTTDQIKTSLTSTGLNTINIIPTGDNSYLIRTENIANDKHIKITEELSKVGENKETSYESVGPTVSGDISRKAIIAVILAAIAIIIYIAIAFRKVPKPASSWSFGICAVLALIHDLIFVIGVFAILGHFFNYEVDSLFVTALLTIMGFSVHDTIVVFDRIRENLKKHPSNSFELNVNNSIIQTLNRSLNTSLTVLIVLSSLYFLGGASLQHFVLALLIGITIGTYSSIFNASPMLVTWQGWKLLRNTKKQAS
jgi:preprotein translocase subunit SecF